MNIVLERRIPTEVVSQIISYRDELTHYEITEKISKLIKSSVARDMELGVMGLGEPFDTNFYDRPMGNIFTNIFCNLLYGFILTKNLSETSYSEISDIMGPIIDNEIYITRESYLFFLYKIVDVWACMTIKDKLDVKSKIEKFARNFELRYLCIYKNPRDSFENRIRDMITTFYLLEPYYK